MVINNRMSKEKTDVDKNFLIESELMKMQQRLTFSNVDDILVEISRTCGELKENGLLISYSFRVDKDDYGDLVVEFSLDVDMDRGPVCAVIIIKQR